MADSMVWIFLAFLAAAVFPVHDARRCYVCQGVKIGDTVIDNVTYDPKCLTSEEVFKNNPSKTISCPDYAGQVTVCTKAVVDFKQADGAAGHWVGRGCEYRLESQADTGCIKDLAKFFAPLPGWTDYSGVGCSCKDADKCNAAGHVTISALVVMLALLFTAILQM